MGREHAKEAPGQAPEEHARPTAPAPLTLTPAGIAALQSSAGNQAVGRMLARDKNKNKGKGGAATKEPEDDVVDVSEVEEAIGEDDWPTVLGSVGGDPKRIKALLDGMAEGNVHKLSGILADLEYDASALETLYANAGGEPKRFNALWRLSGNDATVLEELTAKASPETLEQMAATLTDKSKLGPIQAILEAGGANVEAMFADAGRDAAALTKKMADLQAKLGVDAAGLAGYITKASGKLSSLEGIATGAPADAKKLLDLAPSASAVSQFLAAAASLDMAKLIAAAPKFKREPAAVPAVAAPLGHAARWAHFVERHTYKHFLFTMGNIDATQSLWPEAYTVEEVAARLTDGLTAWKAAADFPAGGGFTQKVVAAGGFQTTIGIDGGEVTQFYPRSGAGVTSFSQDDMLALKKLFNP
jgi:hypothetical protein